MQTYTAYYFQNFDGRAWYCLLKNGIQFPTVNRSMFNRKNSSTIKFKPVVFYATDIF